MNNKPLLILVCVIGVAFFLILLGVFFNILVPRLETASVSNKPIFYFIVIGMPILLYFGLKLSETGTRHKSALVRFFYKNAHANLLGLGTIVFLYLEGFLSS